MRSTIREQPVDDDATNGEQEDQEAPKQFVGDGTIRFEDFNCNEIVVSSGIDERVDRREQETRHTEHDDVQD